MKNILEYLEESARRVPHKTAFSTGKESITFSELERSARTVGSELLRLGAKREAVVVFMGKRPATLSAFFGAIYAGCYYVCVDVSMPDARIEGILNSLSARFVIYEKATAKRAESLAVEHILCYDELAIVSEEDELLRGVRERQLDTDPIYVVFTSGSTGVPKGVVACHRSVIDYTEALCRALPFDEETVFGNQTPLYFDAPLKEIMPTLKLGATTNFIPKMNFSFPILLLDYIRQHGINTVCWVVSALVQISSLGALEAHAPTGLRLVAFGSEVFPREEYDKWRRALPEAEFYNLYGPTEATGMSCYWHADRPLEEGEAIPVGRPFDNTEILLVGEDGREVAAGESGEIYIRGTCVTFGYYGNTEQTERAFVQNPRHDLYPETVYRTGDMGRYNERGELCFLGRKDSQIKHMGHRIELGEIEAAAAKLEGLHRACCVYDEKGKRIVLFFVGDTAPEEIPHRLSDSLPRHMIPTLCVSLPTMPLTDNGKLDRRGMREMLSSL